MSVHHPPCNIKLEIVHTDYTKPYETLALRIAIQLNLLDAIKDEDVTALGLATTTGADRLLIGKRSHTA